MAIKSFKDIAMITTDSTDSKGNLMYTDDSSVFMNTGGSSEVFRQIKVRDLFSKIISFLTDSNGNNTLIHFGLDYNDTNNPKALDARIGNEIKKNQDAIAKLNSDATVEGSIDYKINKAIDEAITSALNSKY